MRLTGIGSRAETKGVGRKRGEEGRVCTRFSLGRRNGAASPALALANMPTREQGHAGGGLPTPWK